MIFRPVMHFQLFQGHPSFLPLEKFSKALYGATGGTLVHDFSVLSCHATRVGKRATPAGKSISKEL